MKQLKIHGISTPFDIVPGYIYELVVENQDYLYKLGKNISEFNTDFLRLYDNKLLDIQKYLLPVFNLFEINANSKKILSSTYKNIAISNKNDEISTMIEEVNSKIINILDIVSFEYNCGIEFETSLNLIDLLGLYKFRFSFTDDSFTTTFMSYINANLMCNSFVVIISYNLSDFINQEELEVLSKELEYKGITIIDLSGKKTHLKYTKTIIIDKELCEI